MAEQQMLEKYAELALKTGVNLKDNQVLMINSSIEGVDFTRILVKKAYELGAKDVVINWQDDEIALERYLHASEEALTTVPQWLVDKYLHYAEDDVALLSVRSTNPDLLKDVDPGRVAKATKASAEAMKGFRKYTMNDKIAWSIISIPTNDWAMKIFPGKDAETAKELLWEQIFNIVRVNTDDPIKAWEDHNSTLKAAHKILNDKKYTSLKFTAPGTEITFGLPKGHIWKGGGAYTEKSHHFNPNMPTEEVFTMPDKYHVDGVVSSTKPLIYGGNMIDNFKLTFKDGKVVDFEAETGYDTLKHLLDTDEGAKRLGEVALVPHHSPISQSGLIFYNTLYDENASCHIALGKAYPTNIEGGAKMSDEELDAHGVNDSLTHVDFMIGSAELDIDGVLENGETEAVFRKGEWALPGMNN
ncbi:aminopeptidase [Halolactibacillus halophilus]|uniref:Aminopeptidase n=1 Tax=Halolactibacillus halophilus TaxID=306540 RepID=A0A1I5M7D2_9BACI|nr:aminopeptidase [Halolactibacillus halophilus]GEM01047.1 aminopeptidase [Halolactibacillus halophilus]SFP05502.1 aminopeptidase [Halolactibacillus halophilus]